MQAKRPGLARVARIFCRLCALIALCCLCGMPARAGDSDFALDFTVMRLGQHRPSRGVVLVVGGIQGDEPGGFSAASLLTTHYSIHRGAVWVVPNLNFPSIIRRSRGIYGDMNRKFARLDSADPEYDAVRRIQRLIAAPQVGLVLNLHDGSGYYRPTYEDKMRNPARWGQSVIIDQDEVSGVFMGGLAGIARTVTDEANRALIRPGHRLHVHNTRTAEGDPEMERSLSYYAVRQGKAAFGLEASKDFSVEVRAYYHLLMVESFLRQAGVEFTRDFALTPQGVRDALRGDLEVSFVNNRVCLPLDDVRPAVNGLPLPREGPGQALTSRPIMAVLPCVRDGERQFCVHYGNRMITLIRPDWREVDQSLAGMRVCVDGQDVAVPFGRLLEVRENFVVHPEEGFRVNAIGFDSGREDESGLRLERKNFLPEFSVDRQGRVYRVEVYRDQRFSGLFLVRFGSGASLASGERGKLPDRPGPESALGY